MSENKEQQKPGLFNVLLSVLAAMVGIQSEKNRERDFTKGDVTNYLFVGVIVVAIFVFSLISFVNSILEDAGM